jgi:hypothetical protein
MRTPEQVFSKSHNTASRRDYIDYDYTRSLSREELEWLAKFTDEYYGASFEYNDVYVIRKNLIVKLTEVIETEKNPIKVEKFKKQLEVFKSKTDKYVRVSNNNDYIENVDLRKIRSITWFYKRPSGYHLSGEQYKYSDNNIMKTSVDRAKANRSVNSNQVDIMSVGSCLSIPESDEDTESSSDNFMDQLQLNTTSDYTEQYRSPEEILIDECYISEYELLLEKGIISKVNKKSVNKK